MNNKTNWLHLSIVNINRVLRWLWLGSFILILMVLPACTGTDGAPVVESRPTTTRIEPTTESSGQDEIPMALIPAGPFEMGSNDGPDDEGPVHTVTLDAFYIDLYEVTNAQYARCEQSGACEPTTDTTAFESSYSRRIYFGNPEYADYPVIYANWYEAQAYCQWRGGRLPTEAEWEKAARGGLAGKLYPWGDEMPVCEVGAMNGANFDDDLDCNDTDTAQVGSYAPNGYGLYDMVGNLWEWVADWYDEAYYASSPASNPQGPEDGEYPVLRGGSWQDAAGRLRVADRRFNPPESGALNIGFRCARDLTPQE
jgi:formylglycine-generating enzyme required for sulfatase activity